MVVLKHLLLPTILCVQALPAQEARMTDAQAEDLAREALSSNRKSVQTEALRRLQKHHFKASLAKEREYVLYAQAMLEDRLGQGAKAATTFHRLEQTWPKSAFLAEGQVIMAEVALERERPKEAEARLRKALGAELPAESVRRTQELLIWCLAEEGRAAEGLPIVDSLKPIGRGRPSERGLAGMMESLCTAKRKGEAQTTLATYQKYYPRGARLLRVNLLWAKLLGTLGEPVESAEAFQKVIKKGPRSREADEARLALATLLTDGRLSPQDAQGMPNPEKLLSEMDPSAQKDGALREALLVKLRLSLRNHQWTEGLHLAGQLRGLHPSSSEGAQVDQVRQDLMRGWAQEQLDKGQPGPLLPSLDAEGIRSLTPAQRQALVKRLAETGLPEASNAILKAAPPKEQAHLRRTALQAAGPAGALALMAKGPASPQEALMQAQAAAAQGNWTLARSALAKAKPGPDRIRVLLGLLSRPQEPKETPAARLKEAERCLAQAREKGEVREPLLLLVADQNTRQGAWRRALALYPPQPQPANRGWVALMRATCHHRLGENAKARAVLKAAAQEPAYKAEREALASRIPER